jgi:uncharacterized protein YgiM (DUF1202 family)
MKSLLALFALLFSSSLFANQIDFFQIQKVKKNDSLNIRSLASHTSEKIGSIPFDAQCVKNNGCGKEIRFEALMHMQEDELKAFLAQAEPEWCYVEYEGKMGWVNQHYLEKSASVCK